MDPNPPMAVLRRLSQSYLRSRYLTAASYGASCTAVSTGPSVTLATRSKRTCPMAYFFADFRKLAEFILPKRRTRLLNSSTGPFSAE